MPLDSTEAQKVFDHTWKYGHFRNPKYPELLDVAEHDVPNLGIDHPLAKKAISSVQASDAHLDILCSMKHGRQLAVDLDGTPDGDAGPATLGLTDIPSCQVPDFGVEFGEAGSGGWMRCDPESDAEHSCRIKFDSRSAPDKWDSYLDDVLENARKISADIGLDVRYVDHDVSDWESSVIFKNIPGGVIGYYYIPQGGCATVPQGALDSTYQPDVELASLLWIHEGLGHGIGLGHTNGGIMNPSIMRTSMSWRNDPSWDSIVQLYGGVPIGPEEPDDPSTISYSGTISIKVGGQEYLAQLIESSGI